MDGYKGADGCGKEAEGAVMEGVEQGGAMNAAPARLFIQERCARLVECLQSLQHDPTRPEDVLKG